MNLFHLHKNPQIAATYYDDSRCVKIILEAAQMLCTAYHEKGIEAPYRATHRNHPMNVWVRSTHGNFMWTVAHAYALCIEYTRRFGKRHKSQDVIDWCWEHRFELDLQGDLTPPPQCMPSKYKCIDWVRAYRAYWEAEKEPKSRRKFERAKWK